MKKQIFYIAIGLVLLMTLISPVLANQSVQAQAGGPGCTNAAGESIPCPPTDDPNSGGGGGSGGGSSGNQNPTAVPSTATALPISAAPTATPKEGYLGQCTPQDDFFTCKKKFECEDGLLVIEIDLYTEGGTTYDFYCIPDENIPQLNLPLTIPDPAGQDNNWYGSCDAGISLAELDECLDLATGHCDESGGEINIFYSEDGGAAVYCQNQSEAGQVAPTTTPLAVVAAPEDSSTSGGSWEEECSWGTCWMSDLACWAEGGKGYGVEDSVGNTGYHCDLPAGSTSGQSNNNLKQLGLAVIVIVLVGMLLPAIQKVREAAAKSRQSKEHILLNKDESQDNSNQKFHRLFGDTDGDSSEAGKPKPKPTPPPSKPKPSGGLGDFNSDGDVDGSDFNR